MKMEFIFLNFIFLLIIHLLLLLESLTCGSRCSRISRAAGQAASVRTFFLMRAKRTIPAPAPNAGAISRIEAYMPALHTMFCRDVVFGIGRVLPHQFMHA